MTDQIKKAAQVAAQWWADTMFVSGYRDQKITRRDGTDVESERVEDMTNAMMRLGAPMPERSDEQKERFRAALQDELEKELLTQGQSWASVDYDPDRILSAAAKAADCKFGYGDWPFKTRMYVKPTSVTVRAGYGAAAVELLS